MQDPGNDPVGGQDGLTQDQLDAVLKAAKEGKLIFLRNDKAASLTDNSIYLQGSDFHSYYEIQPKNNLFILFPSHLDHMVAPHNDDKPRISVSFNFELSYD